MRFDMYRILKYNVVIGLVNASEILVEVEYSTRLTYPLGIFQIGFWLNVWFQFVVVFVAHVHPFVVHDRF